ncbi:DNA ligase [Streptomyces griseoincarnatus]
MDGRVDFGAVQSRTASTPARARILAEERPAHYAVFDLLQHPEHGDVRGWSYVRRRAALEELLGDLDVGPPIQPVPTTTDVETARLWYESLQTIGIEGLVAKSGRSTYRGGAQQWRKVRHAETEDAVVVGFTGTAARPRLLAMRLPNGRVALSQALTAPLAAQVGERVRGDVGPRARTRSGDEYRTVDVQDLVVEVLGGTTRRAVVTVTRVR